MLFSAPPAPRQFTWFTNNNAIMVDARKGVKSLTWPAHPFDSTNYKLNTTGKPIS